MTAPSLYRRHRPRTFDDVVGQEHVVRTLRNALEQNKVHHAYLFVGSRGTGKTSMAKILAACLNCQGDPSLPPDQRVTGPTVAPCGRCEACTSIADATSMDVVEMDAASNNSVDDIRELRDSVAFAPVGGRSKVYILDEAHMLSPQAWNAFLKTLEEPPPRTIFVLATTEASKVLPTVVDRCHRFDFHRPTPQQLSRVLTRVAEQEGIVAEPETLALVSRHATGSFRDALGTLEQLVTYAGDHVGTEDVLSVLGIADGELLFSAIDAIAAEDAAAVLGVASRLAAQGRDLKQVVQDLEAHARALLVVKMTNALPDELRLSPERDDRTVAQAGLLPGAAIIRILDLVAGALSAIENGADPRTQLELLLVRAAKPEIDPQTKALAARIARLESGRAEAPAPAVPVAAPAPTVQTPASAPAAEPPRAPEVAPGPSPSPEAGRGTPPVPADPPAPEARGDVPAAPLDSGPPAPTEPPAVAAEPVVERHAEPRAEALEPRAERHAEPVAGVPGPPAPGPTPAPPPSPGPTPGPDPTPPTPGPGPAPDPGPPAPGPSPSPPGPGPDPGPPAPGPGPQIVAPAPVEPAPAPVVEAPAPAVGLQPSDVQDLLPTIVDRMPGGAVGQALKIASVVSIDGAALTLGVPAARATLVRLLERDDAREAISAALEELTGVRFAVRAEARQEIAAKQEAPLPEDEVVRRVVREFDAEEIGTSAAGAATKGDATS